MALMVTFALSSDAHAKKKRKRLGGIKFGKVGMMTLAGSGQLTSGSTTPIVEGKEGKSGDNPSVFVISPRVGYFVWANKLMGVELAAAATLGSSSTERSNSSVLALSFDPAIYLRTMRRNGIFPFIHLDVGYGQQSQDPDEGPKTSRSGTELRPGVGLNFCIGKTRGAFIRTSLDYEMLTRVDEDDTGTRSTGPALRVGFGAFF